MDMGDALINQGIGMSKDLSLTTIKLLNKMFRAMRDSDTLVAISELAEYKIYYLNILSRPRYIRNLSIDLVNFQATNITSYVMAYSDIHELKEHYETSVVNMPSPFV